MRRSPSWAGHHFEHPCYPRLMLSKRSHWQLPRTSAFLLGSLVRHVEVVKELPEFSSPFRSSFTSLDLRKPVRNNGERWRTFNQWDSRQHLAAATVKHVFCRGGAPVGKNSLLTAVPSQHHCVLFKLHIDSSRIQKYSRIRIMCH